MKFTSKEVSNDFRISSHVVQRGLFSDIESLNCWNAMEPLLWRHKFREKSDRNSLCATPLGGRCCALYHIRPSSKHCCSLPWLLVHLTSLSSSMYFNLKFYATIKATSVNYFFSLSILDNYFLTEAKTSFLIMYYLHDLFRGRSTEPWLCCQHCVAAAAALWLRRIGLACMDAGRAHAIKKG